MSGGSLLAAWETSTIMPMQELIRPPKEENYVEVKQLWSRE